MFDFLSKKKKPVELCFHTDIHCHIVPGVDDGSPDAETSADLVERMQKWGINRIIASPHVTQGSFENTPAILDAALEELHGELRSRENNIEVLHSAEHRIDELFQQQMDRGELMPLPNNYLLVENSFILEPWNLDQLVFDIQMRGFKPILAHPERYSYYYNKMSRYRQLHEAGLSFQINLLSLAEHYGKAERKIAEALIAEGLVDFIGTDLHRHQHADCIDNYLTTKTARKHFEALAGVVRNDTAFV